MLRASSALHRSRTQNQKTEAIQTGWLFYLEKTVTNKDQTSEVRASANQTVEDQANKIRVNEEQASEAQASARIAEDEDAAGGAMPGEALRKEAAVKMIREAAEKLGHAPSSSELEELTIVRRWHIRRIFGSYAWALHECGLLPRYNGQRIPLELLFKEWATVVRKLKKIPSIAEFNETSKYTTGPFQRRFLHWRRVPDAMQAFAKKHGLEAEWQDVMEMIRRFHGDGGLATTGEWLTSGMKPPVIKSDRPVYGPAMVPAALIHEPINEMGVVFLFGTVAEKLGFMVTLVQVEFPDCEALREVGPRRWQRVRIEFEFESRNFLRHAHCAAECDLIVCWVHNWPECPLEVVELREVMGRQ
jgi:hypothetical protein